MKLSTYLALPHVNRQEFAAALGVHVDSLYKWERGDRTPRRDMLTKIAEQTGGAVRPADFFDQGEAA